jgi:flavodoxin
MNTLVIYDSLYGNTKQIAEAIASIFSKYGQTRIMAASAVAALDLTGVGLLALGGPTQGHGISPAVKDLLNRNPNEKFSGLTVAAFETRMHINRWLTASAADSIAKKLNQYGVKLLLPPESFLVEGREGPLEKGEAERAANWARAIMERAMVPAVAAGL